MFQLLDKNVESLSAIGLSGNYSIHPELFSHSAIDGNATIAASTATSLVVRDVKSYYRTSDASYLIFTITGNASSAKIKATTRLALASGNFSASSNWSATQWIMMNGTTIALTSSEQNATSFFIADATKLINVGVNAGTDFNPASTAWQTNAFASYPTNPAPWAFSASFLLNGLVSKIDPYYSTQLAASANATISASKALDDIVTTLAAEGASLRYDKSLYLTYRENTLSHLFASQDIYNSRVGERTVAHVYFTNAADDAGVHHPYMVVATHNATPRPNFLIDVARPPGDGEGGGSYATGTVTRKAVLEVKTVLIPLKNYGLVGNFTDNTLTKSLASDAGLSVGNYTVENYADTASMGVSIDGVVIYPAINNTLLYATAAAEITSSGAHVGRGGALHYHADGHGFNGNGINLYNLRDYTNSDNGTSRSHPPIIGFGYDGIALYGKYESSFALMDGYSTALDVYGGHTHGDYGYHYHSHARSIVGLKDTAGSQSSIPNYTQHFLMVGAWKGSINKLPVLGVGIIDDTSQGRYVGKNGTADSKPVVLPMTISGIVGSALITSITATNSPTSYALATGAWPAGLSLNATTGVISGTPSEAANGTVMVRATNASGNGTGNVTINITAASAAPAVTSTTINGTVGSAVSSSINATNAPTSYAVASGTLPDGLSLSGTSGAITGIPKVAGNGSVTITASNGGGNGTGTITFNISKGNQTIGGVTSTMSKAVGTTAYTLNATSSASLALSYVSSNTSVATVANGTVTVLGAGVTTLTVSQAGDSNYSAAPSVTQVLTVTAEAPVVGSVTINGTVGSVLSANVNATNSPTSYAVASGTLPTGLSLNATSGVISGTPTKTTTGSSVVVVRATNTSGNGTGKITFNIAKGSQTISGVASTVSKNVGAAAYSLNASVTSNLTLSYASSNTSVATVATNGTVTVKAAGTTTLTVKQAGNANYNAASSAVQVVSVVAVATSLTVNGTVGGVLSESINATNSPTSYAVATGTLPLGLSLDAISGVISGTPTKTTTGSSVIVVRVTNALGTGTGKITFNIAKGSQTISGVASTVSKNVGAVAYSLNASVTSNLTLSYASSNTRVATVAANGTVTVKAAGTTTLTVKQVGNTNYKAATSVKQVLTVAAAVPN